MKKPEEKVPEEVLEEEPAFKVESIFAIEPVPEVEPSHPIRDLPEAQAEPPEVIRARKEAHQAKLRGGK